MPDDDRRLALTGTVAGTLGQAGAEGPVTLTSATALPPLEPGAAPTMDDIANNHLFYAFQWFFFAAAAVIIYVLALRGRLSGRG
jgi:surfeit locus 1 family protein